jgi:signal transduction histidine kinase
MHPTTPPEVLVMPADGPDAALYETAIRHAIERLDADGGAIATLDETGKWLVLRVRRVHPRLQREATRDPAQPLHAIEEAATTVLPKAHLWRFYAKNERLAGHVWQTGQPVIMRGAEVQGLPHEKAPADPDAPWHLAVPIFAATDFNTSHPGEDPTVIGVLSVYVSDPQWPFSQTHLRLLQAEAQTIAQALQLARVERDEQRHRRLLALLQELTLAVPPEADLTSFYEAFFTRTQVALSGVADVQAFAVVIPETQGNETRLVFHAVIEDGQRYRGPVLREDEASWWARVRHGATVAWRTNSDRLAFPDLRNRVWGSEQYMESQLFVPLKTASGVVGALLVASSRTNAYTAEHVLLLEMAGRFMALAVENAQIRRARRDSRSSDERALSLLVNAVLSLNATLDTDMIVKGLVEQASELARGQVCIYLEHDRQTDELIIRDAAQNREHRYAEIVGQRVPVAGDRRHRVLEGQTLALDDLASEYGRGDTIGSLLERYHVQAMLLVPVIYNESGTQRERVLGMMAFFAPDQGIVFAPSEELNLQALGRVAAAAIHNAHTYDQLRELDRLKDEFILTASHEFRTPMSAIQGFGWLIQRRIESMTSEQGRHWAGEIMRATEQLRDMMDAITESWRTKSVQVPPLAPVRIADAVRAAVEVSSGLLATENHTVDWGVPEDLFVMGDLDRLRHVISNLLVNAAKYSAANTPVTVTATVQSGADLVAQPRERGALDIDETRETHVTPDSGPWVVVSVRDQGTGISPANQKRLFAKFVRLELTTNVRGTGLGLYICRRYIEAMGGEIWVESMPGQGSTFRFCLPRVAPLE